LSNWRRHAIERVAHASRTASAPPTGTTTVVRASRREVAAIRASRRSTAAR
jgi:hypothetical protein